MFAQDWQEEISRLILCRSLRHTSNENFHCEVEVPLLGDQTGQSITVFHEFQVLKSLGAPLKILADRYD